MIGLGDVKFVHLRLNMKIDFAEIMYLPKDKDSWKIIQSENYAPDRDEFILEKFKKDFKDIVVKDVQRVYALCSRSSALSDWLSRSNLDYSLNASVPKWLKAEINPEDFKKAQESIQKVSISARKRSSAELIASERFKKEMKIAKDVFEKETKEYMNTNLVKILNLKSTDLPITLQSAIEDYTPGEAADSPDKKVYAREVLVRFKISLLRYIKENPGEDIQSKIEEYRLK